MTAMQDLPKGARFVKPSAHSDRHSYEVTTPASEHPRGWVMVRDLSMSDAHATELFAKGGYEQGEDPRNGFFSFSHPVDVEVLSGDGR